MNPGVNKTISVCYSMVKLLLELTKSNIFSISLEKSLFRGRVNNTNLFFNWSKILKKGGQESNYQLKFCTQYRVDVSNTLSCCATPFFFSLASNESLSIRTETMQKPSCVVSQWDKVLLWYSWCAVSISSYQCFSQTADITGSCFLSGDWGCQISVLLHTIPNQST